VVHAFEDVWHAQELAILLLFAVKSSSVATERQYDYGTLPTVQRPFDVGIDKYIVMKKTSPHVRSILYDFSTYVLYDTTILVQSTYTLRGQDL
jgi:hypothetical protein